jgi:hypothetical protein
MSGSRLLPCKLSPKSQFRRSQVLGVTAPFQVRGRRFVFAEREIKYDSWHLAEGLTAGGNAAFANHRGRFRSYRLHRKTRRGAKR